MAMHIKSRKYSLFQNIQTSTFFPYITKKIETKKNTKKILRKNTPNILPCSQAKEVFRSIVPFVCLKLFISYTVICEIQMKTSDQETMENGSKFERNLF